MYLREIRRRNQVANEMNWLSKLPSLGNVPSPEDLNRLHEKFLFMNQEELNELQKKIEQQRDGFQAEMRLRSQEASSKVLDILPQRGANGNVFAMAPQQWSNGSLITPYEWPNCKGFGFPNDSAPQAHSMSIGAIGKRVEALPMSRIQFDKHKDNGLKPFMNMASETPNGPQVPFGFHSMQNDMNQNVQSELDSQVFQYPDIEESKYEPAIQPFMANPARSEQNMMVISEIVENQQIAKHPMSDSMRLDSSRSHFYPGAGLQRDLPEAHSSREMDVVFSRINFSDLPPADHLENSVDFPKEMKSFNRNESADFEFLPPRDSSYEQVGFNYPEAPQMSELKNEVSSQINEPSRPASFSKLGSFVDSDNFAHVIPNLGLL